MSGRVLIAEFCIDGEPVSKARARFTRKGGSYTPDRTRYAEEKVAWAFRQAAKGHKPDDVNAYEIDAAFFAGTRQRRDVDNMVKLICDGLNGVAWGDDNQVTRISGRKEFVAKDEACTFVRIYVLGEIDYPSRECAHCGTRFRTYPSLPNQRHCGQGCFSADRAAKRVRTCKNCGREFDSQSNGKAMFCSRECKSNAARREVVCTNCGVTFSKQACHVTERNYCSPACQQAVIRPIRAENARGTCSTCGGPTSKKSYTNCLGCSRGVAGAPIPIERLK